MSARRALLLAGFGLLGLGAGLAASFAVPPRYQASAFLVVDADGGVGTSVSSLKAELLSPALLESVAVALSPYPSGSRAAATDRLREDLEVSDRGDGTLEVAYTHPDPATARDVPTRLVALVVERASETGSGAEGLSAGSDADPELAELERRIDETRARIERKGAGLPTDAPLRELRTLQQELRALDDAVRAAEQRVTELRRTGEPRPPLPPTAGAAGVSPVEELQAELAALRTRYTDEHPDVQRLLARLRQAEDGEAPTSGPTLDLDAERAAEEELARLRDERAAALAAVGRAESELARAARADAETATLIGELRRLQERYVALRAERPDAGGESAVGEPPVPRVRLGAPAGWPREPSSPSRGLFALVGLVGGLALGGVAGLVADRHGDRIREPADVEALLRAPQLADIPEIRVPRAERDRHRRLAR